jgi:transcription elongation factor Elf1
MSRKPLSITSQPAICPGCGNKTLVLTEIANGRVSGSCSCHTSGALIEMDIKHLPTYLKKLEINHVT